MIVDAVDEDFDGLPTLAASFSAEMRAVSSMMRW